MSDIYMKVEGNGTVSTVGIDGLEGYSRILSVNFGVHSPTDLSVGRGTGHIQMGAVTITKLADTATVMSFAQISENQDMKVDIKFERSFGDKKEDVLLLELTHARITEVSVSGEDGNNLPIETLSIIYQEMVITAHDYGADGHPMRTGVSQRMSRSRAD
jgi:type VI secretion system Hcp family effector